MLDVGRDDASDGEDDDDAEDWVIERVAAGVSSY